MTTAEIIIYTGIACYLLTCLAIIDVATKDFGSLPKKAIWGFVAFIPFIGFLLYFVLGFRKGKRTKNMESPENSI